jgi:signal transduction histidine kinase
VALPLSALDRRVGVLVAGFMGAPQPVNAELLGLVGSQTALALGNALQFGALRELDRLKSEFIGIASHELRTPLSLVLGYSSLLRNRLSGRERDNLQQIINGAIRIGDIVDDLVHLRRSDLNEEQLKLAPVDVWDVLKLVVAELQPLADTRGVLLTLQCPTEPTFITADREKLSLALAHLVDNATKFTAREGLVTVRGYRPSPPDEPDVLIEVEDSGIGIASRDLSRVFERFYQVAPSATRSQTGLGVGLAITKLFVELHGGQVQVRSELGKGSVFQVRLPVAR